MMRELQSEIEMFYRIPLILLIPNLQAQIAPINQYVAVLHSLPPSASLIQIDEGINEPSYPANFAIQGFVNENDEPQGQTNMKGHRIDPKTDAEVYKAMAIRYDAFKKALDDPSTVPITVFNPLTKIQTDQLEKIRELSKSLQIKKDEDIKKQKQTAEEMSSEEEPASTEEKSSEEKDVTEESETAAA